MKQVINDSLEFFTGNTNPAFLLDDTSEVKGARIAGAISGSILWPTGTTAGELVFETSPISGFTGKWLEAMKLTFSAGFANAVQGGNVEIGANYVRARWSVAPVGGATKPRVFLGWQV